MKFTVSLLLIMLVSAACQINSAEHGASVEDLTPVYTSIPAMEEVTEEATEEIQQLEATTPEIEVASASNDLGIVSTPLTQNVAPTPQPGMLSNVHQSATGAVIQPPANTCILTSADGGNVNIRSGPGMQYDLVGMLYPNDWIAAYGRSDNSWYHVDPAGTGDGWMAAGVVKTNGPCANLPLEALPASAVIPTATPFHTTLSTPTWTPTAYTEFCFAAPANSLGVVNIRTGPGSQFDAVNAFGEPVVVTGMSDNGWYLVTMYAGTGKFSGYVPGNEVSLGGNCANLTVIPQSNVPAAVIEHQLPAGTTIDQVVIPPDFCTVTSNGVVNIYSTNSSGSNVVGRLHLGPWMQVSARDSAGWYRVTMINGGLGWVNGAEVNINGSLCETIPFV